jgi:hypothetical protein
MFSRTNLLLSALLIGSILIVAGIAAGFGSKGKARSSTSVLEKSVTQSPEAQSTAGAESTLYVGGTNSRWQGDDVGAQINAAYAALPQGGGTVVILPQPSGECYNFKTQIVANAPGQYLTLRGASPGAMAGAVDPTGLCLNWTVTDSSVPALVLDYVPQIGGGYANSHGLSDLTLTNNAKNGDTVHKDHAAVCQKVGGCGSKAVGIQLGGANSGAQSGEISNVRIMGFGIGVEFKNNGSAISWGMIFRNDSFAYNKVGIAIPTLENLSFFGGRVAVNGTGILLTGGADVYATGLSIDSNSVSGVTGASNSSFTCTNCHFENQTAGAPITTHYYTGTQAATLVLMGGQALDDTPSSALPMDYWFSQSGASLYITGLQVYSAGRRAKQIVRADSPAVGLVSIVVDNPDVLDTILAGTSGGIMNLSAGVNQHPQPASFPGPIQSKSLLLDGSASGSSSLAAPNMGGGIQVLPRGSGTIADVDQAQAWQGSQLNMALVKPTIGGGSPISQVLLHTGSLKFPSIAAGTCQEQTLIVAGATTSSTVAASPTASLGNMNLSWQAWANGESQITIRVCNVSQGPVTPNKVDWAVSIVR